MLQDVSLRSIQSQLARSERFQQICALWDFTGDPKGLVAYMQNPVAARFVWQKLDDAERRCLYELLSSKDRGKGVPAERVQKKTKLAADVFNAAVQRLKDHWFLIEEDKLLLPSTRLGASKVPTKALFPYRECSASLWETGRELFVPEDNRTTHSHLDFIHQIEGKTLEHLAQHCRVPLYAVRSSYSYYSTSTPVPPAEVQNQIAVALQQTNIVFETLRSIDPLVHDCFVWLCVHNGSVPMDEVRTYLEAQQCTGEDFYRLIETLETHALAFDALLPEGERVLFIPQDFLVTVKEEVQQYASDIQQNALLPVDHNPAVIQEGQPIVLYDLAMVIGWVYQQTIETTKEGRILKKWATKIRPTLYGRSQRPEDQEEIYVNQLFGMARKLELISRVSTHESEKPRYTPGPTLKRFQQLTMAEQTQLFLQWWNTSPIWYDLLPDHITTSSGISASESPRQRLLTVLETCETGKWYSMETLLFAIWKQVPIAFFNPYSREQTPLRKQREQWMRTSEGRQYLTPLLTTLFETGVVNLGYEQADPGKNPPELFQVTPLGAMALGTEKISTEPDSVENKLIVQPSFEIVLFQFDAHLIYRLIQFAQSKRIGPVSTFVLTQAALLHGLAAGNSLEGVLEFLTTESQRELPQNVAYSLRDWARNYKEARLSNMFVIELTPAQSEAELYHALADVEVRKLAPGVFAVAAENNTFYVLRKRLEKEGLVVWTER